jgi:hypothetical protein
MANFIKPLDAPPALSDSAVLGIALPRQKGSCAAFADQPGTEW